jgi:hypothetical protein
MILLHKGRVLLSKSLTWTRWFRVCEVVEFHSNGHEGPPYWSFHVENAASRTAHLRWLRKGSGIQIRIEVDVVVEGLEGYTCNILRMIGVRGLEAQGSVIWLHIGHRGRAKVVEMGGICHSRSSMVLLELS